jgi:hypothetical protein
MRRRTLLARTGGVVGLTGIAGCSALTSDEDPNERSETAVTSRTDTSKPADTTTESSGVAQTTRHGISFETVLHAVEDLGMDNTGSDPIDDSLDDAYGDSTLVVFPPGAYLVERQHDWKQVVDGFGMLGMGSNHRAVQFVFPKGNRGAPDPANYWFLSVQNGRNHLLENFTVQQTDDEVTGVGLLFYLEDGLEIHDLELAGFNPAFNHDPGFGIIAAMTTRAGVGVIERFVSAGGGVVDLYPKRKTPIGSFRNHVGELRILEPRIAESGSHSVYVSRTRGCVRIEDGVFVNNDNSNLRLSGGGHPEKRSWAKNCRILIDTENAETLREGERYQGARGIWVEAGGKYHYGHTDLLLENVDVTARTNARPAVLLLHEHSHGSLTAKNCSFESDVEGASVIESRFPFEEWVRKPHYLHLEDVSAATTASQTSSGYAVLVEQRPMSLFSNLDIQLVTGSVNGLLVAQSNGTRVLESSVMARLTERHRLAIRHGIENVGENVGIVVRDTEEYTVREVNLNVPEKGICTDGDCSPELESSQ